MGEVWEARDSRLDRLVAIKLIPKHLSSDPDARRRFVHEAKAASSIEHANICTIHEIDETPEGETFIVMPRYQGDLLSDRIAQERPPLEDALRIVEKLASALAEAHDHNIIHRDVKPSNIFIDPHGRPILLDFGLAKLSEQTKLTKTGTTVGTLAYMAPEQAAGKEVDGRADLFSLGVVLYEMVTGVRPFRGDHDAAVLYSIAHETPPSLASHNPDLPSSLQTIIDRVLAKDPDDPYSSLHDLKSDIIKLRGELQMGSGTRNGIGDRPAGPRWMFAVLAAAVIIASIAVWKFMPDGSGVKENVQAIAVVDFSDLTDSDNSNQAVGMAGLIHVGMVENASCRVVSPSYLQDIRRRLFGEEQGPIEESQALEVARKSGATVLLSGQMGELGEGYYVVWQLVDTKSGQSIAAKRAEGTQLITLADAVLSGVMPALARRCGVDSVSEVQSISELTTADPKAYEYYMAGMLESQRFNYSKAAELFQNAVELDSTFALAYYELARVQQGFSFGDALSSTEKAWSLRAHLSLMDRMRLEAWRYQINYKIVQATDIYRELAVRWPDDYDILRDLNRQLYYWWSFSEALELGKRAMSLFPDDEHFASLQNLLLAILGRKDEAIVAARKFMTDFPESEDGLEYLGRRYLEAGLKDSAEVCLRRAIADRSGAHPAAQLTIEVVLPYSRGDLKGAIENCQRFLERDDLKTPLRERTRQFLKSLYYEAGKYEDVLAMYDAESPKSRVDRFYEDRERVGFLLRMDKAREALQWSEALTETLRVHAEEIDDPQYLQYMGIARWTVAEHRASALVRLDSLDAAEAAAEKVFESSKEFGAYALRTALLVKLRIAIKRRNAGEALALLKELESIGGNVTLWFNRLTELKADVYRLQGRYEEAEQILLDELRIYSGHAISRYWLGLLYQEMNKPDDAAREFRRFLEMWSEADEGLPQIEDAKNRLASLGKPNL